jgi:hypothetical protein
MAIPLVQPPVKATKPASYLRPWFVDDSYATPVRAAKPWRVKLNYYVINSLGGKYKNSLNLIIGRIYK